jgi:hypothetical protein
MGKGRRAWGSKYRRRLRRFSWHARRISAGHGGCFPEPAAEGGLADELFKVQSRHFGAQKADALKNKMGREGRNATRIPIFVRSMHRLTRLFSFGGR